MAEREQLLAQFVEWSARHITGDEKGQAQIFLDRLFQAFGQKGSLDVGGTAETLLLRGPMSTQAVRVQGVTRLGQILRQKLSGVEYLTQL